MFKEKIWMFYKKKRNCIPRPGDGDSNIPGQTRGADPRSDWPDPEKNCSFSEPDKKKINGTTF